MQSNTTIFYRLRSPRRTEEVADTVPAVLHLVVGPLIVHFIKLGHSANVLGPDKVQADPVPKAHDGARCLSVEATTDVSQQSATTTECPLDVDGCGFAITVSVHGYRS